MKKDRRNFLKNIGVNSMFFCTGIASASGAASAKPIPAFPGSNQTDTVSNNGTYNVFDFGARGDGKTLDTLSIQSAIDHCSQDGGGRVYLEKGCFLISTIYMKSNVILHIEAGSVLKSGAKPDNRRMIVAEKQTNITICGRGKIDANGDFIYSSLKPGETGPPNELRAGIISFRSCKNIHVRDVTFYNAASWIQTYTECVDIYIDGITVDSRENKDIEKPRYADSPGRNTDGLNLVDSEKARISNCFIYSGDDGIVLKSFSPDKYCRDITITNCIISTNASGIKFGTESAGTFEDITVQNCVVYDTRNEAIAILTADGARIERVNISNITMRNIKGAAIALRLGVRNRLYGDNAKFNEPLLKDVIIENIQGTRISTDYGCNITGLANYPVENIILKNINLMYEGGGTVDDSYREIPEKVTSYPSGRVFGRIPAYGFFIRHVKNIRLENIRLNFLSDDHRPAILCDNVEEIEIKGLKAPGTEDTPELVRLVTTRDAVISESRPETTVPVFLSVLGNRSGMIILQNNVLRSARQKYVFKDGVKPDILTEVGTL